MRWNDMDELDEYMNEYHSKSQQREDEELEFKEFEEFEEFEDCHPVVSNGQKGQSLSESRDKDDYPKLKAFFVGLMLVMYIMMYLYYTH